jgi:hypothetical protein
MSNKILSADGKEIVPVSEMMKQTHLSPQALRALNAIATGEIPEKAIKTHPGKGGKIFSYVSHIWATGIMNDALHHLWNFEVLEYTAYDDGSANARCQLTINIPQEDGTLYQQVFTEVGAFDSQGNGMKKATIVASAASRGLLRCMLRAFGLGSQFYEAEEEITPKDAWNILLNYGTDKKNGLTRDELVEALKREGFTGEKLVDEFQKAWELVYRLIEIKKGVEELPNQLK